MIFWQCNTIHLYNIPQNTKSLSTIAEIIGQSTFDANLELKLLFLCQLSIYCHQILTQFCCRWNLVCHYSLGGSLSVRLNGSHPPTFCTFAGNKQSSIFLPDNFVRQLQFCKSFGNALRLIITFFSAIWSRGALVSGYKQRVESSA